MQEKKVSLLMKAIPMLANKLGEKSVNVACVWGYHQPKVPTALLKEHKVTR